jgi:hypothetical protein
LFLVGISPFKQKGRAVSSGAGGDYGIARAAHPFWGEVSLSRIFSEKFFSLRFTEKQHETKAHAP